MKKLQAQRVLELEVQNRLSDKQKSGLDQRPELQQDKAVLLGIMMDIAEKEFIVNQILGIRKMIPLIAT